MSRGSTEGQPCFKFIQDVFVSLALCILPRGHGDGWSGLSIGQNIESFGRWISGLSVGKILTALTKEESPAHCGWSHPLAGLLSCGNGERGLSSNSFSLL